MNKFRFWIPCLVGVLITPVFFYASTLSGGGAASHAGAGFQIFVFYPIPFLLAIFFTESADNVSSLGQIIRFFCIGLAVIQFPLFGFIVSYAHLKKGSIFYALVKILVWFHIIVSFLFLLLALILGK